MISLISWFTLELFHKLLASNHDLQLTWNRSFTIIGILSILQDDVLGMIKKSNIGSFEKQF